MKSLTVAVALERLVSRKTDYARLIESSIYDIGIYRPNGGSDQQIPHVRDEVYIIASGTGEFVCGGDAKSFTPGDLFIVPAGAEHSFRKFSSDFATWVIFFGPRPPN
jgi:mannose-6-phosphate isomerase-like protein (cupin superfamily)